METSQIFDSGEFIEFHQTILLVIQHIDMRLEHQLGQVHESTRDPAYTGHGMILRFETRVC